MLSASDSPHTPLLMTGHVDGESAFAVAAIAKATMTIIALCDGLPATIKKIMHRLFFIYT